MEGRPKRSRAREDLVTLKIIHTGIQIQIYTSIPVYLYINTGIQIYPVKDSVERDIVLFCFVLFCFVLSKYRVFYFFIFFL